jgi:hypothetical protein
MTTTQNSDEAVTKPENSEIVMTSTDNSEIPLTATEKPPSRVRAFIRKYFLEGKVQYLRYCQLVTKQVIRSLRLHNLTFICNFASI